MGERLNNGKTRRTIHSITHLVLIRIQRTQLQIPDFPLNIPAKRFDFRPIQGASDFERQILEKSDDLMHAAVG